MGRPKASLPSAAQVRILVALAKARDEGRPTPTLRALGDEAGLAAVSSVHHHLQVLRQMGEVTWVDRSMRTLRLTTPDPARVAIAQIAKALGLPTPSTDEEYAELAQAAAKRIGRPARRRPSSAPTP